MSEPGEAIILFTKDDGLYSISANDGEGRKLQGAEDVWDVSPDGTKLAYWTPPPERGGEAKIYVQSIPGDDADLFLEGRYLLHGWVGSGRFLVIRGEAGDRLVPYESDDGGGLVEVPGWKSITLRDELLGVYCERMHEGCVTRVRDLRTGEERTFPGDPPPLQPCNVSSGACWSQDYRTAAYLDDQGYGAILHVLSAESGVSAPIASDVADTTAVPSPGGEKVAFLQQEIAESGLYSTCTLFVVNLPEAEPTALTRPNVIGPCRRPVWSSDSERIYFSFKEFADFAVDVDGTDGHRVETGEVAYCWTAAVALDTLNDQGSVFRDRPPVAFSREQFPGVAGLARETRLLSEIRLDDDPGCAVSGDSQFALDWSTGGLKIHDLINGGSRNLVGGGIKSAAWAGACASADCPVRRLGPAATPFAGELPDGVAAIAPFTAKIVDPVEHGFRSSPSEGDVLTRPGNSAAFTVIGRVDVDGQRWYYLADQVGSVPAEARFVRCVDVEPCDQPSGGLPEQALVELGSGATLCTVAAEFELTVKEILDYNPDVDPNHVGAGTFLKIPEPVFPSPPEDRC